MGFGRIKLEVSGSRMKEGTLLSYSVRLLSVRDRHMGMSGTGGLSGGSDVHFPALSLPLGHPPCKVYCSLVDHIGEQQTDPKQERQRDSSTQYQ